VTLRNSQEDKYLLTAGEFARLANTSKRTIHWYDKKDLLKPVKTGDNNYRYYHPNQIINFQLIYLMRSLNFSLEDVGSYLENKDNWQELFKDKRKAIKDQLKNLRNKLLNIEDYYQNLNKNGTLIDPEIKQVPKFDIYFIEKQGPYTKIKKYDQELASKFESIPAKTSFLTLFKESEYNPKNAKMVIGAVYSPKMKLKLETEKEVKKMTIPSYKALAYSHYGQGTSLSLMWMELEKYARLNNLQPDDKFPFYDLEFYHPSKNPRITNPDNITYEIHLPVK